MIIDRSAVNAWLERDLDSFEWMKRLSRRELYRHISSLEVPGRFKTNPWLHQLVCFYIAACLDRFLFLLDMGLGKALAEDEMVLTPTGYRAIGELEVGDFVFGANGQPTRVTGVFPQGVKETFTVEFSDGAEVVCCDEHLWNVKTPAMPRWKTLELQQFKDELRYPGSGNSKWFIPVAQPVEFCNEQELPLDPYVLGVLLGDGSLTGANCSLSYHEADNATMTRVEARLPMGVFSVPCTHTDGTIQRSFKGGQGILRKLLRQLGANVGSHSKYVPTEYLFASVEQRKEILAGLLDTDGWAVKHRSFGFAVVSERLAQDVQFLVHSLGGTARLSVRQNQFGPVYEIYGRTPHNPFTLQRKRDVYDMGKLQPTRSIRAVTPAGPKPCVCISVEAEDGLFLASGMVVTHNTKICSDIITQSYREARTTRALVFVPRVINMVSWSNDLEKHSDLEPWLVNVEDTEEKWERLSNPRGDLTIVDFHGAMLACTKPQKGGGKRQLDQARLNKLRRLYDLVAVDEIHMLGNADSLWTRIASNLSETAKQCYGFTGTLFGKDPGRMFSQFYVVDRGETLGDNMAMFRSGFFTEETNNFGREWKFRKRYADELNVMLQHRSISYDTSEVSEIDLPPDRDPIRMQLDFGDEQRQYYLRALEKLIDMQDGGQMELEAPWTRMRQILAGYIEWRDADGPHHVRFKDNPKLKALEYIISSLVDKKLIIAHHYVETGRIITEELTRLKVKHVWLWGGAKNKAELLQQFLKDPTVRVFVMNSDSGGTGTDGLQHVTNYMVLYETPTSPDKRKQLMKRINRPGQRKPCVFYDLVIKNSLDSGILRDIAEGNDLYDLIMSRKCSARKKLGRS